MSPLQIPAETLPGDTKPHVRGHLLSPNPRQPDKFRSDMSLIFSAGRAFRELYGKAPICPNVAPPLRSSWPRRYWPRCWLHRPPRRLLQLCSCATTKSRSESVHCRRAGVPSGADADEYAKHARIVITRIDPLLGEVRHSSPVVQFRLDARPDGHRPPNTDRPYATGRYLEQAKRSAEKHWGTVEVHCSETPFTVVDKEMSYGDGLSETRKVITTNGVDHLADGIVRVAIGVTWLVDCATSDFVESQFVDERGRPKPGPLADYDTIKACGGPLRQRLKSPSEPQHWRVHLQRP